MVAVGAGGNSGGRTTRWQLQLRKFWEKLASRPKQESERIFVIVESAIGLASA
jgi:hypothetical protein